MSTRRARIKAVTSLPPRRKNVESTDAKIKPITNESLEKVVRSPRTPRAIKNHEVLEKKSPAGRNVTPRKSPYTSKIHNTPKVPSPVQIPTPFEQEKVKCFTPKLVEKVPVMTTTATFKDSLFVSPLSPQARHIASPLIKTPRLLPEASVQKHTPGKEKILNAQVKKKHDAVKNTPNKVQKSDANVAVSSSIDKDSKVDIIDGDYNVPSVPESITEDTIMDGIVPLAVASIPKPIALLKNEIISENAEVLFDPIVPLPSPSKVRPKLRPVPRLAPLRRNSIQGSASESEDESRRALLSSGSMTPAPPRQRHDSHTSHSTLQSIPNREVNRIRNDSVCSNVSQLNAQPPPTGSPVKEKQISKSRRQEMSRRMTAMRQRRETVKRDTLTMYDLIYYNPTTNPIIPDQDEIKAKAANAKDAKEAADIAAKLAQEEVDDPPEKESAPVPQIKLGPNGEIILDEKSLIIKQSNTRKVSSVVREGSWEGTVGRYRRSVRTAEWSDVETVRFYRALAAIGTDFTLMEPLFPGRTRRDLKLKFKKEEKTNLAQIDKALRTGAEWDVEGLQQEFTSERQLAERRAAAARLRLHAEQRAERERRRAARALGMRSSKATKSMETSVLPVAKHSKADDTTTADEVIQRSLEAKEKLKRRPGVSLVPVTNAPFTSATPNELNQFTSLKVVKPTLPNIAPLPPVIKDLKSITPTITSTMPSNIESGSLVVLTVNDPNSPSKKMLQTYIAHGAGRLTPVALPTTLLNSVVGYMKKGTPKGNVSTGSSPLLSPNSVASHDSRTSATPGVIQLNCSPAKRQRHSSYTITQL